MSRSILVVVDNFADNGSLRWAYRLSAFWQGAGWAVDFFALKASSTGRQLPPSAGASVTYGDTTGRRFRTTFPRTSWRAVRAAAASDVVLAISEVGLALPMAYAIARLSRRPFVVYVQNIPERTHALHLSPRERPIWRYCLRHADAVLCISPASSESAVRIGVDPSTITVVMPGVEVDTVRRRGADDVSAPAAPGAARPLVACGELLPSKGYDILINALAIVHASGRRTGLVLIGQGPDGPALMRLAEELGISDAITFRGHVENPLPEIARGAAFVHSARVEGVPQVLLEAVALGVPVIATDCEGGGARMILDEGRLGRLVRPESAPALAEAISAHLDDDSDLVERATKGEAHLRDRFLPARSASNILQVFVRLARSRSPSAPVPSDREPRDRPHGTST